MTSVEFRLSAQIPSGKNAIRETYIHGGKVRYPNQRFTKWRKEAAVEIMQQKHTGPRWPLKGQLSATISYCPMDCRLRDVPGMMDALWHLLEHCGIVEDDGQLQDVTWKRDEMQSYCVDLTICTNKGGNREH